jgi:hypothetical protein
MVESGNVGRRGKKGGEKCAIMGDCMSRMWLLLTNQLTFLLGLLRKETKQGTQKGIALVLFWSSMLNSNDYQRNTQVQDPPSYLSSPSKMMMWRHHYLAY